MKLPVKHGSALFSYVKTGELATEGDSNAEGIGMARTDNRGDVIVAGLPLSLRCHRVSRAPGSTGSSRSFS